MGEDGYPVIGLERPTAIEEKEAAPKEVISRQYISMDGKIVDKPARGMYIIKKTYSDKSVTFEKVLND